MLSSSFHLCLPLPQRGELDRLYDSDVDEMFDIAEARTRLQKDRRELQAECEANAKLQRRFDLISAQLRTGSGSPPIEYEEPVDMATEWTRREDSISVSSSSSSSAVGGNSSTVYSGVQVQVDQSNGREQAQELSFSRSTSGGSDSNSGNESLNDTFLSPNRRH
jgi:hypothetical protein